MLQRTSLRALPFSRGAGTAPFLARALSSSPRGVASLTLADLPPPLRIKAVRTDGTTLRFYGHASVLRVLPSPENPFAADSVSIPRENAPAVYAPLLDSRPVLTPHGRLLAVPSAPLAAALAAEFAAQQRRVRPESMPLVSLATTAIDQMTDKRDKVLEALYRFAVTDSVCYRAGEDAPDSLHALQAKHWDPLLDWAREEFGAELVRSSAVAQLPHSTDSLGRLWTQVNLLDDWRLAVLDSMAVTSKSMLVALALLRGRIGVKEAYAASRVDEDWQIAHYGRVEGLYGHGVDEAHTRMRLAAGRTFVSMLEAGEAAFKAAAAAAAAAARQ